MGATFCQHMFPLMGVAELRKEFEIVKHSLCLEHGNDTYAGHLGVKPGQLKCIDKRFEKLEDAEDYLSKHSEKDEPPIAVTVIADLPVQFPVTKKDKDLQDRFNAVSKLADTFPNEVVKRARAMKSKLYTCTHCQSKINTNHVKDIYCPVCSQVFLYTPTDAKRLKAWINKREKLRGQIFSRQVTIKQTHANKTHRGYVWLVGGWCKE